MMMMMMMMIIIIIISDTLKWESTSKAAKRLWFLKKLRQAGILCGWPGTLLGLPNCYKTSSGIRVPSMALQFVKAASKIARVRSTPCSADSAALHTQKPVVCWVFSHSLTDRRSELCRTLLKQIVNNEFHSLH